MKKIYDAKKTNISSLVLDDCDAVIDEYIKKNKKLLIDNYKEVSRILEDLGERDWLTQHLYSVDNEYYHRRKDQEKKL